MDKDAGYILRTIKDRIEIIQGYDIDTTSIESDYKRIESKFKSKTSNNTGGTQVAYTDAELMSIERTIDSFSTYLDNIIKGISVFEDIDNAYEFMRTYCKSESLKSNTAFKKHVEIVANGMLDYGDFYVLGIRKKKINKYFEKLYELIKEEYREFGTTTILTAIEGTKMDISPLIDLIEKQILEILNSDAIYKKEYLSGNILENGKINRNLLAIVSLVENDFNKELTKYLVDLNNRIEGYKTKLEDEKRKNLFDFINIDASRYDIFQKTITSLLAITTLAAANTGIIKNRNVFGDGVRRDYVIEENDCRYVGFEKVNEGIGFDGVGYLYEYSETRPDNTKVVKEYKYNKPSEDVKNGKIEVTEKMLQSEKIISVDGTDYPEGKFYEYQEYTHLPAEGFDYVVLGFTLLLVNYLLSALHYLITGLTSSYYVDTAYNTIFVLMEDIYNGITIVKSAIEEMKKHKDENKNTAHQIELLEERYKELTDKFSEAKKLFSDPRVMANAANSGYSLKMSLELAKRLNKEQLIVFYYLLNENNKARVEKHSNLLLNNQITIIKEFKEKDEEEQKEIVEKYLSKLENKKTEVKEEPIKKVEKEVKEKKQEEKEVKENKHSKAESIIKAIENLSESIRLYSEYADASILEKLYHTVQIDEDTLFEKVEDHYIIRREFIAVLKFLNLAYIDTTDLKVSDIDFRGTNIRINPQVVYNKDLSYSKFDDENIFGDFTGCNLKGTDISKESLPVGINQSIIDEDTVLPEKKNNKNTTLEKSND